MAICRYKGKFEGRDANPAVTVSGGAPRFPYRFVWRALCDAGYTPTDVAEAAERLERSRRKVPGTHAEVASMVGRLYPDIAHGENA